MGTNVTSASDEAFTIPRPNSNFENHHTEFQSMVKLKIIDEITNPAWHPEFDDNSSKLFNTEQWLNHTVDHMS